MSSTAAWTSMTCPTPPAPRPWTPWARTAALSAAGCRTGISMWSPPTGCGAGTRRIPKLISPSSTATARPRSWTPAACGSAAARAASMWWWATMTCAPARWRAPSPCWAAATMSTCPAAISMCWAPSGTTRSWAPIARAFTPSPNTATPPPPRSSALTSAAAG